MSSDRGLKIGRIIGLSVIPLLFLVSTMLVLLRVVGVEIGRVFGLLLVVEGVVVGILIAFEKVELWVGILEVFEVVLPVVILGIIAKDVKLALTGVILEVFLAAGSYALVKIIKIYPQIITFICITFVLWFVLSVFVEKDLMDSFVVTMLIDIVFNNIYQYYIGCNEIYYLHKLGESGFNKEYFDLYFNRINIFYRVGYYLACISTVIYIKGLPGLGDLIDSFFSQYEVTPELVQLNLRGILDFVCTYLIFVCLVLMVILLAYYFILIPKTIRKHFRSMEKLLEKKKDNFGPYTDSEKEIILE